ncbi:MAG TPA: cell envelope integrity protein CreD [Povalibacter sp.]|nr:cell envelope integrity protein CreD [Povalibacter sp.]
MAARFGSGSLGVKIVVIGALVALLLIPLMMLQGLVSERASLREQAYAKVARGWGGEQIVGGPILTIPTECVVTEGDKTRVERSDIYLLPAQLDVNAELKLETEPRYVGIYAVPVYQSHLRLVGQYDFASLRPFLDRPGVTYLWDQARLRLPLSEVRSLREVQQAHLADRQITFGPAGRGLYPGIEAPIDSAILTRMEPVKFDFTLVLAGSRDFSVLPLGSVTTVELRSDWPHPSFQGAFLPVERTITDSGFEARWQVLELNRSYRQAWMEDEVEAPTLLLSSFGVGLYQTVDVYQRSERAVKYALLFIALTFLTFFAWEQISGIRIHPLQYLLVGLALSVFYLLLIALSEHISFAVAYVTAASGLVVLIGTYLAGALHSHRRGIIAGGMMTVVYGLLYVLVLSEDYALLLGAVILFAALAAVMLATRKIDWYRPASVAEGDSAAQ